MAVTPNDIGDAWGDRRVRLDLAVELNGAWFGKANGAEMNFGFHQFIAYAATTQWLSAGTFLGSGTVSNADGKRGSACIAGRRAIQTIEKASLSTSFMRFGDRIRMEALWQDQPLFGVIDQKIVRALPVDQLLICTTLRRLRVALGYFGKRAGVAQGHCLGPVAWPTCFLATCGVWSWPVCFYTR